VDLIITRLHSKLTIKTFRKTPVMSMNANGPKRGAESLRKNRSSGRGDFLTAIL
jgi:hypothetical protein